MDSPKPISEEDQRRVERALTRQGIELISPSEVMGGGYEHVMVYVQAVDGREVVLRLFHAERPDESISKEVSATQWASEIGVGPKVLGYDAQERILCLEYLPPDEGEVDEGKMVRALRRLQEGHWKVDSEKRQPFRFLTEKYASILEKKKTVMQELMISAMDRVFLIERILKKEAPVLCHGDFHQRNVIMSKGHAYLIDWTTAAFADRFYDLAKYSLGVPTTHCETLLQEYCDGEVNEGVRAHFEMMRMVTLMTLVLNRYDDIAECAIDDLDRVGEEGISYLAMNTIEEKRQGALCALKKFLEWEGSMSPFPPS